ncbi:hypothetical protein F511_27221 [Dorcoceras hygrometricum]|uniref:Uncharacterized protein n=1 Tax=Dorcoceras hygrometricum TaxID=472368 RepID=A0A2Z7CDQ3_9LAMI|nr:hypothetical protein F511_27221 [Dorcoceras hygrometricum]
MKSRSKKKNKISSGAGRIPLEDLITAVPALTQSNSPQAARTPSTQLHFRGPRYLMLIQRVIHNSEN